MYIVITTAVLLVRSIEFKGVQTHLSRYAFVLFALLSAASSGWSATIYNEAVSGDLSNNGLTPTSLLLATGSNQILGTTGRGTAVDRDYFTLSVPAGFVISQIVELAGTQAGGVSFFGIQAGAQITVPPTAATADGLLGWWHYESATSNTDILPDLRIPSLGSSGFSDLNSGTYAFWVQDFTAGSYNYAFDLVVTPTPEPATVNTTLATVLTAGLLVWKRSRATIDASGHPQDEQHSGHR